MSTRRPATSSSTLAENAAQRLSALLVADQQRTLGMRARDARVTSGHAQRVAPPQDFSASGYCGLGVFGKILPQIIDEGSFLPDRSNLSQMISNWLGLRNEQQLERRRLWLRRFGAEGPGGVSLWAARFRYGELPCILLVTEFLVLRAGE
jgi:hypothetical protein